MAKINLSGMDVQSLLELRRSVDAKLDDHKRQLEKQLERLSPANMSRDRSASSLKGRKVAPKYRSKKVRSLTWAGRGAVPLWMRDEMKAGKLKKEAFLIK